MNRSGKKSKRLKPRHNKIWHIWYNQFLFHISKVYTDKREEHAKLRSYKIELYKFVFLYKTITPVVSKPYNQMNLTSYILIKHCPFLKTYHVVIRKIDLTVTLTCGSRRLKKIDSGTGLFLWTFGCFCDWYYRGIISPHDQYFLWLF